MEALAEVTLVVALITDASRIDLRRLGRSTAPGFAGTPLTAYREPMEVLEWMMLGAQEPRTQRPHEAERPRLRCGSGG